MSDSKALAAQWNQGLSPFGANAASHAAYRRAERIVLAAHLVTNFIPEYEPLRAQIRTLSLRVLESVLELREGFRAAGPERVNDVIAVLLELSTLFETANASGFLSRMNSSVLGRACVELAAFLRQHEDAADAEGLTLSEEYFTVPESEQSKAAASVKDKEHAKRREVSDTDIRDKRRVKRTRRVSAKKTERRNAVLKLVRERKRVSVRDVAREIPGYSEKTLQRELLALAREGIVRKEGERRWSRYVLVE